MIADDPSMPLDGPNARGDSLVEAPTIMNMVAAAESTEGRILNKMLANAEQPVDMGNDGVIDNRQYVRPTDAKACVPGVAITRRMGNPSYVRP